MTLRVLESFDGGDLDWQLRANSYSGVGTTTTGSRTGANALVIDNGSDRINWLIPSHATAGLGAWVFSATLTSGTDVFSFYEDTTLHMYLAVNTANRDVTVHRGDGTQLGSAAGAFPSTGSGAYFEMWVTIHDSTGTVQVWKNQTSIINLTGQDTRNGGTAGTINLPRIGVANGTAAIQVCYDDVYIADGAGSLNNAGPMEVKVETRLPNGNGNYSQLVGSDADSTDNYLLVDEASPSSTDYTGSSTNGNKDSYAYADLAAATGAIKGLVVSSYAAKTAAGAKGFRAMARRAGVDGTGADVVLSTSYDTYDQVWETDPTDASAWSVANVNASEIGFEVRP